MYVIEVIPLIKGTKIDTLSYYSATSYAIGTFLTVQVRNKNHQAIVTDVHSVSDAKNSLRSAAYTLKKLPAQEKISTVPECLQKTALALTKHYPSSVGAILFQLLPPEVRNGKYKYPSISSLSHGEESAPQVLTAMSKDRYVAYRSHIRSVLARRGSVLFVVPTSTEVEIAKQKLAQGIEDRVVVFSPTQTDRERMKAYTNFEDTSLAKLIITTPSHAYLDRVDLLSIIIDNEASEYYNQRQRPYLDHRLALQTSAKVAGRSIMFGDILPRPETEYFRRQEIYNTEGEETKRLNFTSPLTIIEQTDKPTPETPFKLFSDELTQRINEITAGRGRVFLYGARRGISPVVVCIDCGHIFRCPDSGTPYSLLRTISKTGNEERWFVSTISGKRQRASDTCDQCGSWRLKERGVGIQTVFDECVNQFPNRKVLLFDHITASTKKRASEIIADFYANRSCILVGTQISLPYLLSEGVELSAVISQDAAKANPTWRSDESFLRLLLLLREFSEKETMIQTRSTPDPLLGYAASGMLENFYTEELSLRQMLKYPPFNQFILVSWQGDVKTIEKVEVEIKKRTEKYEGTYYNNPLSTEKRLLRHGLFRFAPNDPKRAELIDIIRHFPPYIKVEINPSRIV